MAFSRIGRFPLSYMLAEKALITVLGIGVSLLLRTILRRLLASQRSMAVIVGGCVVASYLLAMVWTAGANLAEEPIGLAMLGRPYYIDSIGELFGGTVYNSFTLVAWGFLYLGLTYYLALQGERERTLRAETLVAEVRLRALRYQLNPHLFFNTLNGISTLVAERRNEDATLMIARLGDFLRSTLRQDLPSLVPFAEELSFAGQYLDIEQIRFGERLQVTYDVEEDAYRVLVPLLLLQPLLENAVRHGVAAQERGGSIDISARVRAQRLEIAIANSGSSRAHTESNGGGLGLANTRERLLVLYGDRQSIRTSSQADGGFRVELEIPVSADPSARAAASG